MCLLASLAGAAFYGESKRREAPAPGPPGDPKAEPAAAAGSPGGKKASESV